MGGAGNPARSRLSAGGTRWKAGPQPKRLPHTCDLEIVNYWPGHDTRLEPLARLHTRLPAGVRWAVFAESIMCQFEQVPGRT